MNIHNSIRKKDIIIKFRMQVHRTKTLPSETILKRYNQLFQNGGHKNTILEHIIGIFKKQIYVYTFMNTKYNNSNDEEIKTSFNSIGIQMALDFDAKTIIKRR